MIKPVQISLVSYLNSVPFKYGIQNWAALSGYNLSLDYPAVCARKLAEGEVDLGLVPVAVIPQIKQARIVTDFCIGAVGKVDSVLIVSPVPVSQITELVLDYQSRTSVKLAELLCKEFWQITPRFISASEDYLENLAPHQAAVVIGDRAFEQASLFPFVYDLPEVWYQYKKLPFVFACWVANKELDPSWLNTFNEALAFGLKELNNYLTTIEAHYPQYPVRDYLTNKISYSFDEEKKRGLAQFLSYLGA